MAVQHVLSLPRSGLHARMGMGKTSIALDAISALLLAGEVEKVLVLAPLRVARSTWSEEAAKWTRFEHLKFQTVLGTSDDRCAALRNDKADIYTINYDNLPWLMDQLEETWPFDMVVADESVRLKNYRITQGSVRAQVISGVAHTKVKRWLNLTGLAAPNGLQDLWGQLWFIDRGFRLGASFSAYQARWFMKAPSAGQFAKTIPQRHAQAEIEELIRDVCLALHPKDWFDLKDPIVTTINVDLPPEAQLHYREMEDLMFTEIKKFGIEAFSAGAKYQKCMQIANGAAYTATSDTVNIRSDTAAWVEVHDAKIQVLDSIIAEAAGEPMLVAYNFRSDLARLKKAFPAAVHIKGKKEEDAFKRGEIAVALVHPDSVGHGVDGFQMRCRIVVFWGHSWRMESREQLIERVGPMRQLQAGFDREVFVYNIVARGTIDEEIVERNIAKYSVEEALMLALRRRG
jgi:SNF2 family DNA or RNA helicase